MYLNNVELIGFLGSDAAPKTTESGASMTTLSLATKTTWMKDNERQERIEWHPIVVFGNLADYAAGLKKGAYLRVAGELRSREYEKDGTTHRAYDIVARSVLRLRGARRADRGQTREAA